MMEFALEGNKGKIIHGSHSRTELKIKGTWYLQGPQPVGDSGCPEWVSNLFDSNPKIKTIALSGEDFGSVWSR